MLPIERIDYSSIRNRPRAPGGLGHHQHRGMESARDDAADRSHGACRRLANARHSELAWHEYGNRVGFWRMLEVLDRFRVRAALAIDGSAIRAYEPISLAALERGWEFVGHGFGQKNMQKVPDERADVAKTAK